MESRVGSLEALEVGRAFAAAYAAADYDRVRELLADDVRQREINPREYLEFHNADEVIEEGRDFWERHPGIEVIELDVRKAGELIRIINRWRLTREDGRVELCDFYELVRVEGAHVVDIDLVCSGWVAES